MSRLHELLPWYVNNTLTAAERAAFENHLPGCENCSTELSEADELQAELPEATDEAIALHPTPQEILDAVDPGPENEPVHPEAARTIRRHLAICVTCAAEARWLRGENIAQAGSAAQPRRENLHPEPGPVKPPLGMPGWLGWIGWAAAATLAAALMIAIKGPTSQVGPPPTLGQFHIVPSAERSLAARYEVEAPPGADLTLFFEVDLAPEDFPVSFQIRNAEDETVLHIPILEADALNRGSILFQCGRAECPDGEYVAVLSTKHGDRPDTRYPFRVSTP